MESSIEKLQESYSPRVSVSDRDLKKDIKEIKDKQETVLKSKEVNPERLKDIIKI
jgi:hypothetical protein